MHKNRMLNSPIVSCHWLHENLDHKDLIVLAAYSDSCDFNSEYLPNSRGFDLSNKFRDTSSRFPNTIPSTEHFQKEARLLGINKDSIIVVYDSKGIYWSPRVWWLFKTFGFSNIAVLDGGLPEWKAKGFTIATKLKPKPYIQGNFIANFQEDNICFFKDINDLSSNSKVQLLDARSPDRFQCKIPESRKGLRSGRLPNSKNLFYKTLLNHNCLRSKSELSVIFDTFDIKDKSLVFSCGSGVTACILALAAAVLDFNDIRIYDGSWTEYGTLIDETNGNASQLDKK